MMKEITVVMPVYKVEKYVSECLDSIINQTFDCFECIIIDDCSPDNSMRLIEEKLAGYKGNISFRIVRNERNEGVSAARNKGIELSRGGYLFFIDSDDMLYENCLEKLWEETKRHPGIDLVQGDSYSEGMENKNSDLQRYTEGRIRINKLFLDSKIISTPVNRLIRKEVLTENAIYFRSGILFEDFLWCYFLYKKVETFASVNSFTYFYRRSNPSSTMNKAKTDFDKPAKDFIFILTVFNEHMEQELYAENICFILNKLMPVVYNAAVIGVTRESNDAIDKFKRNLIRKHCREFRPMEVLYELNLFYPFSLLLNWGIYRHHILYKYANLIKLYYKIWGRLYR